MTKRKLSNPHVNYAEYRSSIGATDEKGRRFHFWVDAERKPMGDVLYMNAPLDPRTGKALNSGEPGYFPTRRYKLTDPAHAGTVRRMWELVDAAGLWDKARADYAAEEAAKATAQQRGLEERAKRLAGPQLYAALTEVMALMLAGPVAAPSSHPIGAPHSPARKDWEYLSALWQRCGDAIKLANNTEKVFEREHDL